MSLSEQFANFPTTRWSLIGRLWHADDAVRRDALAELLKRYLPALRSYLIYSRRIPADRADDLLQAFTLSKVLEDELLQRADPQRGRFRGFLLKSLDHFVASQRRRETALKRFAGMAEPFENVGEPISAEDAPERMFDVHWARELLAEAVRQMRAECETLHRPDIWGVFQHRILSDMEPTVERLGYAELVQRFALASPAQAANVLVTGKRMFSRVLRGLVLEYEPDEACVEQEIAELRTVLSKPRD